MKRNRVIFFVIVCIFIIVVTGNFLPSSREKSVKSATDSEYDISGEKEQNEISDTVGHESEDSEVRVKNSKGYHELYKIISATYGYIGDGSFASDTGPRLHNLIRDGDISELPVIAWDEDFFLEVPEELDVLSIDCMTEEGERVLGLYDDVVKKNGVELKENGLENYKEYFSGLPKGVYYVAVEVYRQGRYIEAENEYEYSLEQYAFCMEFS